MVSIDPALNETTRFADVILPPRHGLENDHFSLVFHKLAVRDTVKYCSPVFEPAGDSLSEMEICGRLCAELTRLRSEDSVAAGGEPVENTTDALYATTPEQFISMLLASGPYGLSMDDIKAKPAGIDLGSLKEGGLDRAVRHKRRQDPPRPSRDRRGTGSTGDRAAQRCSSRPALRRPTDS